MERAERKSYIRLIYARTFRYFAVGLALSAVAGGLYGELLFTVYALSATGCVMLCWGWFTYLKSQGVRLFGFAPGRRKAGTPYVHQRFKEKKPARPSFMMNSDDFGDDLSGATAVNEESFTPPQIERARMLARAAAGALLIIASFVINS